MPNGSYIKPPTPYVLTNDEKKTFSANYKKSKDSNKLCKSLT
jgi:hypothetical protein